MELPSRHCEHGSEFDHISRFCESQKYKTPANLQKVNTHNDRSVDKLGRDIKCLDGKEICNYFNFVARKLVNSYTHAFHAREGITTSRPVRATKVISTTRKIKGRQSPDINDIRTFVNSPINVNRLELRVD
jgi:hypothetical protein